MKILFITMLLALSTEAYSEEVNQLLSLNLNCRNDIANISFNTSHSKKTDEGQLISFNFNSAGSNYSGLLVLSKWEENILEVKTNNQQGLIDLKVSKAENGYITAEFRAMHQELNIGGSESRQNVNFHLRSGDMYCSTTDR